MRLGLCGCLPKEIEQPDFFFRHILGLERIGCGQASRLAEKMAIERTNEITLIDIERFGIGLGAVGLATKIASGKMKAAEECGPPLPVDNGVTNLI